ncbi:EAL domain-containing protein [Porphyrobacter sp. GA68]|uniref:EAL domain-containing protein n=1 Tax=Porphyrobacter sp. GA68 TaxID=2883480 RepID=UPI001D183EBC|nr:EAL domain-containing protein [Porphyrobacter sp. GA68]
MRKAVTKARLKDLWERLTAGDEPRLDFADDDTKGSSPAAIRLRHLAIAFFAALALGASSLLDPLDQLIWTVQMRMVDKEPSGDIVFVGLGRETAALNTPEARRNLAHVLDRLQEAGPKRVVLDVPVQGRSTAEADLALRDAIARHGDKILLVQRQVDDLNGGSRFEITDPYIAGSATQVPNRRWVNYLGYAWQAYARLDVEGISQDALATVLADAQASNPKFLIDYRYNTRSITTVSSHDYLREDGVPDFRGKSVVIGNLGYQLSTSVDIPGRYRVPTSFITILAAETLKGGVPKSIFFWLLPVALLAVLFATTRIISGKRRALLYCGTVLFFGGALYLTIAWNMRAAFSAGALMLLIYAGLRGWWRVRRKGATVDQVTGLETFGALERTMTHGEATKHGVIVARIPNFDDVLATLPEELHPAYLKTLSNRLRVADESRSLYYGGNGYFAWLIPAMGRQQLTDHLTGIRQLCYEPVEIGQLLIDIKVTFGVNASADQSLARKIASARKAASRSNEADEPIVFVTYAEEEQRLWNLSIQHKIDRAIDAGHIYPVFQPQFCAQSGRITGVEALVRWNDPARGAIATDWFIDQCEQAGRMDRLTRLMLTESMRLLLANDATGGLRLSVNISAISLQDERLAPLVQDAIRATGFDPTRLTLEITETWRIANPERAAAVMAKIGESGVAWALDDFGVKTATFDALMMYPVSELKIDRSLTSKVLDQHRGCRIVRSICQLGVDMNVTVVAEGVELEGEFAALQSFGCSAVQGFALAPPLAIDDLRTLLAAEVLAQEG